MFYYSLVKFLIDNLLMLRLVLVLCNDEGWSFNKNDDAERGHKRCGRVLINLSKQAITRKQTNLVGIRILLPTGSVCMSHLCKKKVERGRQRKRRKV